MVVFISTGLWTDDVHNVMFIEVKKIKNANVYIYYINFITTPDLFVTPSMTFTLYNDIKKV